MKHISKRCLIRNRRLCVECAEHRSLFRYRGVVKADDDHTLCFRCYRALRNSMRHAWQTPC